MKIISLVLLFDVLGTCVKVRPTIPDALVREHVAAVGAIVAGRRPFVSLDVIHGKHAREWERLEPWPDARAGLAELRQRFPIGTLSNSSPRTLRAQAAYAGFTWDYVLSSEDARQYKPAAEVYLSAEHRLDKRPGEIMLVAAHRYDLHAAKRLGWRTALILRPGETEPDDGERFDYEVRDLRELAKCLRSPCTPPR